MSAEISRTPPPEGSPSKEVNKFISPFPLKYEAIHKPFDNPDEELEVETPIKEALTDMIILRSDMDQAIDVPTYIQGVAFTRIAINRQMEADNIPKLNNEQLEFTSKIYALEWATKLNSAPNTPDLNTSSHINTERIKKAQFLYDNSIPRFNTDLRTIKSIFKKEDERQVQYLFDHEQELNQYTIDYLNQRFNLRAQSYSFHAGITDTYFLYNTYFEALKWKNAD